MNIKEVGRISRLAWAVMAQAARVWQLQKRIAELEHELRQQAKLVMAIEVVANSQKASEEAIQHLARLLIEHRKGR